MDAFDREIFQLWRMANGPGYRPQFQRVNTYSYHIHYMVKETDVRSWVVRPEKRHLVFYSINIYLVLSLSLASHSFSLAGATISLNVIWTPLIFVAVQHLKPTAFFNSYCRWPVLLLVVGFVPGHVAVWHARWSLSSTSTLALAHPLLPICPTSINPLPSTSHQMTNKWSQAQMNKHIFLLSFGP